MISEQKLKGICEEYNINFENLIKTNQNILGLGNYAEIRKVLDYLRDNLKINPSNIEKCSSILYRNVFNIERNYKFLKEKNIHIKNVESCLHVLSNEPEELKETFEYVKENYGIKSLENNTSILAVSTDIIESVEDLNINFKNKNCNLTIAVGIEFGNTNLENVKAILSSQEYKEHPELFTSTTLAHSDIDKIKEILSSQEYKEHPELFTSTTLAHSDIDKIKEILSSQEYKEHPELFTSETLAHSDIDKIKAILSSQEYKEHPELFTSETLAHSNIKDISKLLKLDYWQDERYKNLLTSTILSRSKSMLKKLPILFKMAEHFNIDDKLTTSFLLQSPSQNYAIIKVLEERQEPLIVDGKLNPTFGLQPGRLLKRFNIDLKVEMKKYPFDESILDKKDGFKDCIEDNTIKKSDISKISSLISERDNPEINNQSIGED